MANVIIGRFGRATAGELYTLLGLASTKLPETGMPGRLIQGHYVYVRPLPVKVSRHRNFDGLRVMTICVCGQHLAVGRMHQHKCKETR